ncbi:uncharacterized protein DUF2293 [Breznakibacter xylanolyticus]|uniref:Uncharacterized protein DUF2293 n=1 Tax=Breznakibacter xylanolyticus TaxID=990 RepID=A0A2W7NKD4_9BACT|nr:DUF2293 domain-containing protein [Breznakibacter xylanolyticus]PZX20320.1 uncharacterized protein DUF2293 [Breznakibacter xylanolyticus]
MAYQGRIVGLDPKGKLIGDYGEPLTPPAHWAFLPAGDAGVTRKVTAGGDYWRVQVKKGRRTISKGIWASAALIAKAQAEVEAQRGTETYQKRLAGDRQRRQQKQEHYEVEFFNAVRRYLHFDKSHQALEEAVADAVTRHAIPVGSGTVARTAMIPLHERASRAVIAWMRHQTTAYDRLKITPVKGQRRAVRRELAQLSVAVLDRYRQNMPIPINCPLQVAVKKLMSTEQASQN